MQTTSSLLKRCLYPITPSLQHRVEWNPVNNLFLCIAPRKFDTMSTDARTFACIRWAPDFSDQATSLFDRHADFLEIFHFRAFLGSALVAILIIFGGVAPLIISADSNSNFFPYIYVGLILFGALLSTFFGLSWLDMHLTQQELQCFNNEK